MCKPSVLVSKCCDASLREIVRTKKDSEGRFTVFFWCSDCCDLDSYCFVNLEGDYLEGDDLDPDFLQSYECRGNSYEYEGDFNEDVFTEFIQNLIGYFDYEKEKLFQPKIAKVKLTSSNEEVSISLPPEWAGLEVEVRIIRHSED